MVRKAARRLHLLKGVADDARALVFVTKSASLLVVESLPLAWMIHEWSLYIKTKNLYLSPSTGGSQSLTAVEAKQIGKVTL